MRIGRFTSTSLRLSSGVIIWAVHFAVIYGFTALACARGFAELQWLGAGVVTWTVVGATAIAVAATLLILVPAARAARGSFEDWMTAGVAGLALIAIVWETVPVIMVPTCG